LSPNASISLGLPQPGGVIDARFTAESICKKSGSQTSGVCSVRVMVTNLANGVVTELSPAITTPLFAFDSYLPGSVSHRQGHAIERSHEFPPGKYTVQVELKVTPGAAFVLRYRHLAVEVGSF
jgi:hypothetical protein